MKRAKSKFSNNLPKYQDGSKLLSFLNQPIGSPSMAGAKPMTAAGGIGMGLDMVGSMIPQKQPKVATGIGEISSIGADKYNKQMQKIQGTKSAVSGALSTAGNIASMIPGIGTAVGLGLKGLSIAAKALPFGAGKEREAKQDFEKSVTLDKLSASALGNAEAKAMAPKFQAPAYGKKGMKLKYKTKY